MNTWVILITDGTVIEYAPEAYESAQQARDEAQRWAWVILALEGSIAEESLPNRWRVRDKDVRLVESNGRGGWVGTFWTGDGYPDPEAVILADREAARAWTLEPLWGRSITFQSRRMIG